MGRLPVTACKGGERDAARQSLRCSAHAASEQAERQKGRPTSQRCDVAAHTTVQESIVGIVPAAKRGGAGRCARAGAPGRGARATPPPRARRRLASPRTPRKKCRVHRALTTPSHTSISSRLPWLLAVPSGVKKRATLTAVCVLSRQEARRLVSPAGGGSPTPTGTTPQCQRRRLIPTRTSRSQRQGLTRV